MTAKRKATSVNEAEQHENPLISNRTLRQIYTKLVELRALDEHSAKMPRRIKNAPRRPSIRGQEAARVSALIDLKPGDLISDATIHPSTELILGADLRSMRKRAFAPQRPMRYSLAQTDKIAKQLPPIAEPQERLQLAMGSALALKTAKQGNIILAFVAHRELSGNAWKKLLTIASRLELPIIFVVLRAGSKKNASKMKVCDQARLARVPGIPVDSADAIALFRVMQESLGRTRGGDGPVVIECSKFNLPGQPLVQNDPIIQMGRFLLERRVFKPTELDAIHKASQRQLRQSRR